MTSHNANRSPRCQFRTPSGRRCRRPIASVQSQFCDSHFGTAANRREAADLSTILAGGLDQFKSPAAINDFLSRLLLLLSQNRISPRRAAVLAYITNQLLRTVSAMEQEAATARDPKNRPLNIIWNIPRPPREQEEVTEHNVLPRERVPMSKRP